MYLLGRPSRNSLIFLNIVRPFFASKFSDVLIFPENKIVNKLTQVYEIC